MRQAGWVTEGSQQLSWEEMTCCQRASVYMQETSKMTYLHGPLPTNSSTSGLTGEWNISQRPREVERKCDCQLNVHSAANQSGHSGTVITFKYTLNKISATQVAQASVPANKPNPRRGQDRRIGCTCTWTQWIRHSLPVHRMATWVTGSRHVCAQGS